MSGESMKIKIVADADSAALEAASLIALEAGTVVAERGRFIIALSGGRSPEKMLRALAGEKLPWKSTFVMQVDERVAPQGSPERNLTNIHGFLVDHGPLPAGQLIAMPVDAQDLEAAATIYARILGEIAGTPPVLDLAHLGLGPDGHTASLVPGDPVLGLADVDVAMTEVYQSRRRMTLTYPMLNRSRRILWLVTGYEKAEMLARLRKGDHSIPAGCVAGERAMVIADRPAAAQMKLPQELGNEYLEA
jgi:6-phosphogluconolactonase